jgi:hypothetical protein
LLGLGLLVAVVFISFTSINTIIRRMLQLVIQSTMSPKAIIEVWEVTVDIFKKYNIPIIKQSLETLVRNQHLPLLLQELNYAVGSSSETCIEGG